MISGYCEQLSQGKDQGNDELDFEFLGNREEIPTHSRQMSLCRAIVIENKRFIFGLIPRRVFILTKSFGTHIKQCMLSLSLSLTIIVIVSTFHNATIS